MKNEQFTEQLVRQQMEFQLGSNSFGEVYSQGDVFNISKINDLLLKAGGKPKECELSNMESNGTGKAKPEYIITFHDDRQTILVIECKKQAKYHKTLECNKPQNYAVDGVLYYAKFLKAEYNVIAIAVSGTDKEKALLDVYYWEKNQKKPILQKKLHNIFLTPDNYLKSIKGEKISKSYSLSEIRDTAIAFHNRLRTIKVTERQKPIFIAGILIALEDASFSKSYISLNDFDAVMTMLERAIERVLDKSDIAREKLEHIKTSFKSISLNEKLKQIPIGQDYSLTWYIEQLEMKIKPMMNNADYSLDALGVFYHEFVKYSGGDGRGLGIVLTPQHLTEFMCELAEIDEKSYVLDICCGSGSFLVSAMSNMFQKTADEHQKHNIRQHQLHGVELDPDLYVLSIANMIIRKDGKSNIIHGDCFDKKITDKLAQSVKKRLDKDGQIQNDNIGFTAGLLNPPYSQKDIVELEFVEQLLSLLVVGSKAAVVVPMACAIGTKFKAVRKRLFEKHTLKAVFSMPDDIFYPTGTNVCVMVWEAGRKHNPNVKTFFAYCKDDGFVKRKKIGRVDVFERWENIKKQWLELYRNGDERMGLSAKYAVNHDDEWLAEAYMKTDYSQLSTHHFAQGVRDYRAYQIHSHQTQLLIQDTETTQWKPFRLLDFFEFKRGTRLTKVERERGKVPLVTAGEGNLGVKEYIGNADQEIFENAITIDMFCNSYTHIQPFCCDDNVLVLQPKLPEINQFVMLFLNKVIEMDKYRYQYGRQYRQKDLKQHEVYLPVNEQGLPDWVFMADFIQQLPYANEI